MEQEPGAVEVQDDVRCSECGTVLTEGQDRQQTEDAVFCRPCFNNLTAQVQEAVAAQTRDINYPMALVGGLTGGAVGVVAWWGFTVVTNIAFGLVAIVIGLAVAKGIVILSGDKRGLNLQIMSVVISTLGFFYASYLVNRTFINRAYAEQGQDMMLPWVPSPELAFEVLKLGFGVMDLVFLAIVVYEAWKIPAPIQLNG